MTYSGGTTASVGVTTGSPDGNVMNVNGFDTLVGSNPFNGGMNVIGFRNGGSGNEFGNIGNRVEFNFPAGT